MFIYFFEVLYTYQICKKFIWLEVFWRRLVFLIHWTLQIVSKIDCRRKANLLTELPKRFVKVKQFPTPPTILSSSCVSIFGFTCFFSYVASQNSQNFLWLLIQFTLFFIFYSCLMVDWMNRQSVNELIFKNFLIEFPILVESVQPWNRAK